MTTVGGDIDNTISDSGFSRQPTDWNAPVLGAVGGIDRIEQTVVGPYIDAYRAAASGASVADELVGLGDAAEGNVVAVAKGVEADVALADDFDPAVEEHAEKMTVRIKAVVTPSNNGPRARPCVAHKCRGGASRLLCMAKRSNLVETLPVA